MAIQHLLIIGCGVIARTHAKCARAKLGASLKISAADPDPRARETFLKEHPDATLHETPEALLAAPPAPGDVVIAAVPPFLHEPMSLMGLRSGRHVLCEKPLSTSFASAQRMVREAESRGLLLGCCSCRFLGVPTTEHVRSLLADGFLGDYHQLHWIHRTTRSRPGQTYQPSSLWFLDKTKSGGGPVNDWGVYDFSTLLDLLRPDRVEVAHAWIGRNYSAADPTGVVFDVEDQGGASLRFEWKDGRQLAVRYERAAWSHGRERSIVELEGSRGAIAWDWMGWSEKPEVICRSDKQGEVHEETVVCTEPDRLWDHDRPILHFAATLEGRCQHPMTNRAPLFSFAVVRAIYDAAASGKNVVVDKEYL
jgi:predicted dehydrogenase